jgi:hypothetical protein
MSSNFPAFAIDSDFVLRASCFLLVTVTLGCNSSADREKVVPVSGTVTYQGKPLEGFRVTFMPSDGRRPAIGLTDAAGKFALGTNDVGDGAVVGTHKVAFVWAPPVSGEPGQETVTDNPANLPKPKTRLPDKYGDPEKSGITQEVPPRGISGLKFELQ